MKKPILVLQMLRLGDIVLSFPLFLWLARQYPGHPIWVVAESAFYGQLMPVSPQVTYIPWEQSRRVLDQSFLFVLNLSHRSEAAHLAGDSKAEDKFGPVQTKAGLYIHGGWQLYRASLVENNRYNSFHWGDLNALDVIPLPAMAATRWSHPRILTEDNRTVGLFLGASEEGKRPRAQFWAQLVRELLRLHFRPVLFGGPAEQDLGRQVKQISNEPVLNYCGKLDLAEFCKIGQTVHLFVTPDTGPMHLAAWTCMRVLNLSMGPVNPWETGPYQPGHFVLQPALSCTGCWTCFNQNLSCQNSFEPRAIADLIRRLITNPNNETYPVGSGLRLLLTTRDEHGFFGLRRVGGAENLLARDCLREFWDAFWKMHHGIGSALEVENAWFRLSRSFPRFAALIPARIVALSSTLRRTLRDKRSLDWRQQPPFLRPLTGYLEHLLHNSDGSPQAQVQTLAMLESFLRLVGKRSKL